ncbi:MAG: polyphosphate kinase 2, partial [Pseudomonadota bacterium]|nr:polyphosphate kinase 2 [Pseudomonadota bacterium]
MLFALENDQEFLDLQVEMVRLQNSIRKTGKRLLIIFEGRDAAGKGSTIMRFVRFLNPRHYRIVALAKPTEQEAGQWY